VDITLPKNLLFKAQRQDSEILISLTTFLKPHCFIIQCLRSKKRHIADAAQFELSKVTRKDVQERFVKNILGNIDADLGQDVADRLGLDLKIEPKKNHGKSAPSLSIIEREKKPGPIKGRKIAIIVNEGFSNDVVDIKKKFEDAGLCVSFVSNKVGTLTGGDGKTTIAVEMGLWGGEPSLFDASFVHSSPKQHQGKVVSWIYTTYKQCKTIGVTAEIVGILEPSKGILGIDKEKGKKGFVVMKEGGVDSMVKEFTESLSHHRIWERQLEDSYNYIPA